MSDLIARTIDLGFGTTTVITNVVGSNVELRTFQSIAAPLEKGKGDLMSGSFSANRIVKVCVDGIYYAVGEDVQSYIDNHESRVLNNSFVKSKQYQAIFLSALSMMEGLPVNAQGKKVIDLLAMGLPVNNMSMRTELNQFAKGEHVLPDGSVVLINEAWTIAQPVGGLVHHGVVSKDCLANLLKMRVLVADPGMGTFDWLTAIGLQAIERRCGSNEFGMAKVLSAVSDAAKPVFNLELKHEIIDRAFYLKEGLCIAGKKYPFPICSGEMLNGEAATINGKSIRFDFTSDIQRITDSAAEIMRNNVGDGQDIDLILVTGGAAPVFMESISNQFPFNTVKMVEDPMIANALGIQQAAAQKLSKMRSLQSA